MVEHEPTTPTLTSEFPTRRSTNQNASSSDDVITSADSGFGRSLETLDSESRLTSGCLVSDPTYSSPVTWSTNDVISHRRKRRSTRLPTVDEMDVPEPEVVTLSRGHVTRNDVIESPMTTRRRRKVPESRGHQSSSCSHFYGE